MSNCRTCTLGMHCGMFGLNQPEPPKDCEAYQFDTRLDHSDCERCKRTAHWLPAEAYLSLPLDERVEMVVELLKREIADRCQMHQELSKAAGIPPVYTLKDELYRYGFVISDCPKCGKPKTPYAGGCETYRKTRGECS